MAREYKVQGEAYLEKVVTKDSSYSARIYVPKKWVGRKIAIILLENGTTTKEAID